MPLQSPQKNNASASISASLSQSKPSAHTGSAVEPEKLLFLEQNCLDMHRYGYSEFFVTNYINLLIDKHNPNSRVATGEYFPNTFWAAVRQRSRWTAGICFQNWKMHKWA